ncbi:MAG TPA: exonuclease subunit SbcD [Dysgonamonadaceae bacterium]|nr:exonuclease subunit SbcD [Dysgonamonadaceae bacterium]
MKILHTADWHLGKRLDSFSRLEEQKIVLDEICIIADEQAVDAVIVAGDLFDAFNPPVEAIELLYKTLKRLTNNGKRPVIAIAGNHDSPDRIDSPEPLARECGIVFMGYPNTEIKTIELENGFEITKTDKGFIELNLPEHNYPLRIIATPYANEVRMKEYFGEEKEVELSNSLQMGWGDLSEKYCDNKGVNILVTHLYMLKRGGEVLEEPDGEKPLKIGNADLIYSDIIPPQIQYTALGHLHRHQNVGTEEKPVVYSGSPLSFSFSEAGQQKYVNIINVEPNNIVQLERIPLKSGKQLARKTFNSIDLAVEWLSDNQYTLVELTIKSDTYLKSEDLKRLRNAHHEIVHIIPIVKNDNAMDENSKQVNLNQDITALFSDYFKYSKGQSPNEEIIELFKEIIEHTS